MAFKLAVFVFALIASSDGGICFSRKLDEKELPLNAIFGAVHQKQRISDACCSFQLNGSSFSNTFNTFFNSTLRNIQLWLVSYSIPHSERVREPVAGLQRNASKKQRRLAFFVPKSFEVTAKNSLKHSWKLGSLRASDAFILSVDNNITYTITELDCSRRPPFQMFVYATLTKLPPTLRLEPILEPNRFLSLKIKRRGSYGSTSLIYSKVFWLIILGVGIGVLLILWLLCKFCHSNHSQQTAQSRDELRNEEEQRNLIALSVLLAAARQNNHNKRDEMEYRT